MKKEKKLKIFIDGGSRGNPGHGACAAVFFGSSGAILREEGKYLGRCTNNFAEYSGLRLALAAAGRLGAEELEVFSDSELLVRQFSGQYRVKDETLAGIMAEIRKAAAAFKKISVSHVKREKNKEADRLVNQILDNAKHVPPAVDRILAEENAAPRQPKLF
ncbi:MAG: ribonuclease HI family protein [Elusimicrobiota bacterium]|nr:ribonuclease HI family protein [Elusimicrobiota bacterium]